MFAVNEFTASSSFAASKVKLPITETRPLPSSNGIYRFQRTVSLKWDINTSEMTLNGSYIGTVKKTAASFYDTEIVVE